ncbi:MAG TPA: cytochrome c [Candidatus Dormibacteraeota bacterium]|nr:cytochrome c [Candidatus Dormibacteraeota bacterium]
MTVIARDVCLALLALVAPAATLAQAPLPTPKSVRITMEALHAAGGVPPGWELALQAGDVKGGRLLFMEQGCISCHVVQGANLPPVPPAQRQAGPELTGMGSHHPPVYFLEAIVNPNAVLVEGPGYINADGRSTMPAYPDLTVAQLQDLVAFLSSLTTGGDAACHAPAAITPGAGPPPTNVAAPLAPTPARPLPVPPSVTASMFLVQTYDVLPDKLGAFQEWFQKSFAPALRAFGGIVSVETTVDRARRGPAMTTVIAFRDRTAYDRWNNNIGQRELAAKFDEFIGVHGHIVYDSPPLYRAAGLSE